jgi:hypothetical protein
MNTEPTCLADAVWSKALDDFAAFLLDHAAVAAQVREPLAIAKFSWPTHLGPMPASMLPRATRLAAEARTLIERHQAHLAAVAGQRRLLALAPMASARPRNSFDVTS